jgi:cytochrome c-type biogenesis protein CcmH
MMVFLIVAAVMLATALFFILPTLLRKQQDGGAHAQRDVLNLEVLRDQLRELDVDRAEGVIDNAGYDSSRKELEQRVVEDVRPGVKTVTPTSGKPWSAIVLAVLVPAAAIALYFFLGHPLGLDPSKVVAKNPQQEVTPEQINAMVDKLARHLKEAPDDIEGWNMAARTYTALGRFADAADAYSHLVKLVPPNADLLVNYAYALGMANHQSLQGEPEKLILHGLEIDPKNIKALNLAGAAAYERHDYAAAVIQWRKIMQLVPPTSDVARAVGSSINDALSLAGTPGPVTADAADTSSTPVAVGNAASAPAANAEVSGTVELDPALRSQVSDTDTVFIFARAVDGPRFPLAVLRRQVKDLPATFTLDDSMSMMPNVKLSGFAQVVVGARISKSGSATPSAGDLEGVIEPVKPGAKNLKVKINSQRK